MKANLSRLLLLLLVVLNTSCLKKQDLSSDDLGPAIDPADLSKAISTGFGPYDYNDIKAKEESNFILTQRIQDVSTSNIEQQNITVNSVENNADALKLNLLVAQTKYEGNQGSLTVREWSKTFEKTSSQSNSMTSATTKAEVDQPTLLFFLWPSLIFDVCKNSGTHPETCHNLQVSPVQYPVPSSAAAQHNCADPNSCFVTAYKIEFDMIQLSVIDKDGKPKRVHYTLVMSPEVPFLSRFLQYCTRSLYDINGANQKILADVCYNITNYSFGVATKTAN